MPSEYARIISQRVEYRSGHRTDPCLAGLSRSGSRPQRSNEALYVRERADRKSRPRNWQTGQGRFRNMLGERFPGLAARS